MRILHLHSGNLYGGVERVLGAMARSSSSSGMEPVFALSHEGRIAAEIRAAGAKVHILGPVRASRPLTILAARARVAALCRGGGFDAVIAHSAWSMALLGPAATRPLIYYQHDLLSGQPWTERWARRLRPDLVIANSDFAATTTERVYPGAPLAVVHPPVELLSRHIPAAERRRLRESLGTPPGSLVLLQASRFEKLKGQRLLLDALSMLDPDLSWFLWIAGAPQRPSEGALCRELKRRAQALGIGQRIRFLGHVEDMPRLMQSADIYCQTNTSPESFGLTFIEALHAGLPVLSTNRGGAKEILDPDWGLLVEPVPEAIATGLHRLLTIPIVRESMAEAGPLRARLLCDPRTQLQAFRDAVAALVLGSGEARARAWSRPRIPAESGSG